jgi:hypothetical protein
MGEEAEYNVKYIDGGGEEEEELVCYSMFKYFICTFFIL